MATPSTVSSNVTLFTKTRICRFHAVGRCTKGESCPWAHGSEELNVAPDLTCTRMCQNIIRSGTCTKPGCTYAHNLQQMRTDVGAASKPGKNRRSARQLAQQEQWTQSPQQEEVEQFCQEYPPFLQRPETSYSFGPAMPPLPNSPFQLETRIVTAIDSPAYIALAPGLAERSRAHLPSSLPMKVELKCAPPTTCMKTTLRVDAPSFFMPDDLSSLKCSWLPASPASTCSTEAEDALSSFESILVDVANHVLDDDVSTAKHISTASGSVTSRSSSADSSRRVYYQF